MAKIRIYELARDLNMTNKLLLEKLRDMDISVKSHMGSLDAGIVSQIKMRIFGLKEKEVEETRIKPTVIRRRRKTVKEEPIQLEATAEPEVQPEEAEADEQLVEKILKEKVAPTVEEVEETAVEPSGTAIEKEEPNVNGVLVYSL